MSVPVFWGKDLGTWQKCGIPAPLGPTESASLGVGFHRFSRLSLCRVKVQRHSRGRGGDRTVRQPGIFGWFGGVCIWVWVDQSEIHFAWLITSSDQLAGSKALPPGLELAFIFRGNEVEHLGLGPQSLGFLALGNFPGGLWFLFIKYTLESHDGVLHALSWAVNKEMMVNKLRCCLSLPLEMVCLADREHFQGVSGELSLVFLQLLIHSFCTLD